MNAGALYRVARGDGEPVPGDGPALPLRRRPEAASVALWMFMAVVTSLFSLFIVAYGLRMDSTDWHPIAMPWQVWMSTALLLAGGIAMSRAARLAARGARIPALQWLAGGGAAALAFVASQAWAWSALHAAAVAATGQPAASFFYLLTGMHALHVAGGVVAWLAVAMAARHGLAAGRLPLRIRLLARYWHFMLAVWLALLGALGWLTPEIVRMLCGTSA